MGFKSDSNRACVNTDAIAPPPLKKLEIFLVKLSKITLHEDPFNSSLASTGLCAQKLRQLESFDRVQNAPERAKVV
jgi:hypothetical protein